MESMSLAHLITIMLSICRKCLNVKKKYKSLKGHQNCSNSVLINLEVAYSKFVVLKSSHVYT